MFYILYLTVMNNGSSLQNYLYVTFYYKLKMVNLSDNHMHCTETYC